LAEAIPTGRHRQPSELLIEHMGRGHFAPGDRSDMNLFICARLTGEGRFQPAQFQPRVNDDGAATEEPGKGSVFMVHLSGRRGSLTKAVA
jgi:hypothetical protein